VLFKTSWGMHWEPLRKLMAKIYGTHWEFNEEKIENL
jgi:hypothetical protein